MKILLIDDDDAILRCLSRLLSRTGHPIRTASTSMEALDSIRAERPDVIVCDLNLQGDSGLCLQSAVELEDPDSARRFVFMTGDLVPDADLRRGTLDERLQKPFGKSLFLEVTTRLCQSFANGAEKLARS